MPIKTSYRWLLTLLACLFIFLGLAFYKYTQIQGAIAFGKSFPEPSESVEAVVAATRDFVQTVETIGVVVAPQIVELRNELEGKVEEVLVRPGDKVSKGQLLVQLDISEEEARLQAADARVKLASLDLERVKRLIQQQTVSKESLDKAEADFAIARADVKAIKSSIAKKSLKAPFDARVGIHSLDIGEYLQSNTSILSLVGTTDYSWVDFDMPLQKGQLEIGTDVMIDMQLDGIESAPARIIASDVVASAQSRNIRWRAQTLSSLPVPANSIVRVAVPQLRSSSVVLPRLALMIDPMGDFVYVLEKDPAKDAYRARRQPVKLGEQNAEEASVISGLQGGELIAVHGAFKLTPGLLTYVRERPELMPRPGR